MIEFYHAIDPFLIWLFRLPHNAWAGFGLGLFCLALTVTVIGELAMAGVYFLNRRHFSRIGQDMVTQHNLSLKALAAKDKACYTACNSLANEAFGQNFFSHMALFASSVWPVPFVLGWLDFRFASVDFGVPFVESAGPAFLFIPLYIVVRVAFARSKHRLPLFRDIRRFIKENEGGEELMSYADIMTREPADQEPSRAASAA